MLQLILVVLAIALAALLVAGGVSYLSTDIGLRVEVAQGVRAQHDALRVGISNYRSANNGFVHSDIERLMPYLPAGGIPPLRRFEDQPFEWSVVKSDSSVALCVRKAANGSMSAGLSEGLATYAAEVSRNAGTAVSHGTSCENADLAGAPSPKEVAAPAPLAVKFGGN